MSAERSSPPGAYSIVVLPGDGIGPEVVAAARAVLDVATGRHGVTMGYRYFKAGAGHYRDTGVALDEDTAVEAGRADAVLLGAMGLPDVRLPDGTEITPQIDLRERY